MRVTKVFTVLLLLWVTLLGACSFSLDKGVEVQNKAEDFDFQEIVKYPWAVGGVVFSSGFVPDGSAEIEVKPYLSDRMVAAEFFSPMLSEGLSRAFPLSQIWSFESVKSMAPGTVWGPILEDVARARKPSLGEVKSLGGEMEEIKYMVFARIENTKLKTNDGSMSANRNQRYSDGREPHTRNTFGTITLTRVLTLSIDLYDLNTGALVWRGTADHEDTRMIDGKANEQSNRVKVIKDDEGSEPMRILLDGTMRDGPSLIDLIPGACTNVAREMIAISDKDNSNEW